MSFRQAYQSLIHSRIRVESEKSPEPRRGARVNDCSVAAASGTLAKALENLKNHHGK
jgi:hypothetical protein